MIREFKEGDIDVTLKDNGKSALLFFIPDHCAGCKRAINILNGINTDGWDIALVNTENFAFRDLISDNDVTTAPTLIYNNGTVREKIYGLKRFLDTYKKIFGIEG